MNHQHIHWLGHASFRIEDGATQIYVDPGKLAPGAPKDVAYQIKGIVIAVSPGEIYNVGELKVKTVPAYNIGKQYHPKRRTHSSRTRSFRCTGETSSAPCRMRKSSNGYLPARQLSSPPKGSA